ncbi:hypothetical protein GGS20DRAFT_592969 [Poronia punctata]|nr:hypothetical protein GGS20DRAFT_592969 [Poronia punctata]
MSTAHQATGMHRTPRKKLRPRPEKAEGKGQEAETPSQPSKEIVMISCPTTFVGFQTMVGVLEAGYHVVALWGRSSELLQIMSVTPMRYRAHMTPRRCNLLSPSDVKKALNSSCVDYFIHMASPMAQEYEHLTSDDNQTRLAKNLSVMVNILFAAMEHRSIKRIIVTSSAAPLYMDPYGRRKPENGDAQ